MAHQPNPTGPASTTMMSPASAAAHQVVGPTGHRYTLQVAERRILAALGGRPWTLDDYRSADVCAAVELWGNLRASVGLAGTGGWMTTGKTNPKLGKAGVPTVGLTLHSDRTAAEAWASCTDDERHAIASALGVTVDYVRITLAATVCPHATGGCKAGCVTGRSFMGTLAPTVLVRLLRTAFVLVRPADALTLTAHHLERTAVAAGGRDAARWRVNISDDIRWEVVAPGLLEVAPMAYTYTKWPSASRPELPGLRIVYSANERWTDTDIAEECAAGRNVAVVLDLPRRSPLPTTWRGLPAVDGDSTDDLWEHPAGTVVGLVVKGRSTAIRREMADCGFARPA